MTATASSAVLTPHALISGNFSPMLKTLSNWLDKAAESHDLDTLAGARLAPDMFPLSHQVAVVCHQARLAAAKLAAAPASTLEPVEPNRAAMQARIAETLDVIGASPEAAYAGAESRDVVQPLIDDLVLEIDGGRYLRDWILPNFYFHLVTAYAILRNAGVPLGKPDYLGPILGGAVKRTGGGPV